MNQKQKALIAGVLKETGLLGKDVDITKLNEYEFDMALMRLSPQKGEKDILTQQSNEWLPELMNKVLTILTFNQLKTILRFEEFSRGDNINGIIEMLNSNIIEGIGFSKETTIEQFNPSDPEINKEYLLDQYKEYYPIQFSTDVITRAFTSGSNFMGFLNNFVGTIVRSESLNLYKRVVGMVNNYPFRTTVYVKRGTVQSDTNKNIIKALELYGNKLLIPSTIYNENGFTSSATVNNMSLFTNVNYSGEIAVDVLASLFNTDKLSSVGMKKYDIEFEDPDVYCVSFDSDKIMYGYSIKAGTIDKIGINLKTIQALHVWYGMVMLKSMSGVKIKVVDELPSEGTPSTINKDISVFTASIDGMKEKFATYTKGMNKLKLEPLKEKKVEDKKDNINKLIMEGIEKALADISSKDKDKV